MPIRKLMAHSRWNPASNLPLSKVCRSGWTFFILQFCIEKMRTPGPLNAGLFRSEEQRRFLPLLEMERSLLRKPIEFIHLKSFL